MRSNELGLCLNNQEKGALEFAQPTLAVKKGDPAQVVITEKVALKEVLVLN